MFPFNGEIEILSTHINEHAIAVDYFVIFESSFSWNTQANKKYNIKKPIYLIKRER